MTFRSVPVLAALLAVALVAGCGRKAALDTPYEAAVQARKDAERDKQPLPPEPAQPVKNKPFALDFLIK